MKVRVLETGEVAVAKRFKDMSEEEINNSVICPSRWDGEDLFIEPEEISPNYWRYMYDEEVGIISDSEEGKDQCQTQANYVATKS